MTGRFGENCAASMSIARPIVAGQMLCHSGAMAGQASAAMFSADTDFTTALPFPVRPVPRVATISAAEFRRSYRRREHPVIIEGAMKDWEAVARWSSPERLLELVDPARTVYCRQRTDLLGAYTEDYVATTFGDLLAEVFGPGTTPHYLTQGLVFPARGRAQLLSRPQYPALLEELAVDCRLPQLIDDSNLSEGVLWLGKGGQVTPLHFDATENLNGTVCGRKRWVLFPPSEARHLLEPGNDGRGSVLGSIEKLMVDGAWTGGPVTHAFTCETKPGEMLYLPAGYVHQVYSSDEPNMAVNFWFVEMTIPRIVLRQADTAAIRRFGYHQPAKRAVGIAILLAMALSMLASYGALRGKIRPATYALGPTDYSFKPRLW